MLNITTYYRTRSYHLTLARRAVIKSLQIPNVGDGVEKREPRDSVEGTANWCNHRATQYGGSSKIQGRNYSIIQQFHSWVYTWEKRKTPIRKDTCTPIFTAAVFIYICVISS